MRRSSINGHPAVLADGVDDFMMATLNPPMPVGSRPHFWAVLRQATPRPANTYVRVGQGGSYLVTLGSDNGASPNWLVVMRGTTGVSTPSAASANNTTAHIVTAGLATNLQDQMKIDGASSPATIHPGPIASPVGLVRLFSNETSGFAHTRIGEVIISRTTPPPEVDRAVHEYLAAKWRPAAPACGNGAIDGGEECDDGNANANDVCRNNCTLSTDPLVVLTPATLAANATTWNDANGGNVVFQASAGSVPLPTNVHGVPAARFNGYQHMHASLGDTAGWSGVTITAVVRTHGGVSQFGTLLGSGGPSGASATSGVQWAAGVGSDPVRGLGRGGATGGTHFGGSPPDSSTTYVMTWKSSRAGAGWTIRRNGTALTSVPVADGSFPTGEFRAHLGAEAPGLNAGVFTLVELHIYPRELNAAETTQLELRLAETYAIGWYADGAVSPPDVLLGADLVAWYDATALQATDGAPLGSWPSSVPNAALTATGASQPQFEDSAVNGHPGVVGDGVDDFMVAALNPVIPAGSHPHFWVVMQNVNTLASRMYVQVRSPNNNQGATVGTNSTNWLATSRGSAGYTSATSSLNTLRAHIIETGMSADFQRQQFTIDGQPSSGTIDPGTTSTDVPEIRVFSTWNNIIQQTYAHANTGIGEIIVSRTTPTPQQSRAIHRYLAQKWRKTPARCGDSLMDPGEQCDDGNRRTGTPVRRAAWSRLPARAARTATAAARTVARTRTTATARSPIRALASRAARAATGAARQAAGWTGTAIARSRAAVVTESPARTRSATTATTSTTTSAATPASSSRR